MADNLKHAYDAIRRREYYLKTRQLKGRQIAVGKSAATRKRPVVEPLAKTRAQRQAARRKQIEAQVAQLKSRLEKLRTVLDQEVKKAKALSGQQPKKTPAKTSQTKSIAKAPKLSGSQKAEAVERAEDYRKKNPDQFLADEVKSLNQKIKTIQERIIKMRKNGSVGARRTAAEKKGDSRNGNS